MISALGHCEDPSCSQLSTSNNELVRLFRCSIHCDRLLCLYHLNAHNVYYEEERKQNETVINELQNNLTLYQTIFEQHIQEYRELVHQATTLLLHNTSSIIPIEQIRPILEKLQRSIAIFRQEKVIIKSETTVDMTEFEIDSSLLKDVSLVKQEKKSPTKTCNVVVRLERVDYNREINLGLNDEQINKNLDNNNTIESINNIHDEDISYPLKTRKIIDENHRSRALSPASSGKKKCEKIKKKTDKITPLKRLQT